MQAGFRLRSITAALVFAALACVPAAQSPQTGTDKRVGTSKAEPQTFEVLVQYRDGTKEADKVAIRKSVGGRLKETLKNPGLEVLLVPKSEKLNSPDGVVLELRRNKAVRIAEPQQTYSKQPAGRG